MADFLGVEWVDHNPPRITRVSPEDAAQGRGVDLYGKDLAPNGTATVHVGNHTVEPDYINDGGWWVRFTVPDIPVGTYNLSIVRDGERLTYNGTFRVLPPLELDASVPTHVAPGESIVYEGEGFDVGNLTVSTHHFVSREERELPHEVLADDRLRVTVPANVTGPHQGLSIQRSDGAFLFDWHALLVNLPDLALSVVREPEPRRTLAPEPAGGADWVLEVRNVGTETLPADADDPVTLGAEAWGTDPPYGEWVGTWNLTEEIPPDGSRRFGIDIHPVCGCDEPWRQVPVGNWTGWAYLSGNRPPDLVWDNDLVRFEHRFLLPETPSLAPADALP